MTKIEETQLKLKKLQTRFEQGKTWASELSVINWELGKMDVDYVQLDMPRGRGFTNVEIQRFQEHIDNFFKSLN